jgi:trk system potassium uptake protein TrkA
MYAIVVGCGRVGSQLAMRLSGRGHEVTVIDHVGSSFSHLDPAWRGRTIEAEAMAEGVLERAAIERAGALAAVTNADAVNAVVARVARTVYRVPTVVSRNYDPRWRPLHEAMGLEVVASTAWGAERACDLMESPGMRVVFSAGNGEVALYEVRVPRSWCGRPVSALVADTGCNVLSLTRGGRAVLPAADLVLDAGDLLHVGAGPEGAAALGARLATERG